MTKPNAKPSPNPYRDETLNGIRKGADALHARATFTKPKTYTDAESAAIARAKLEGGTR